MRLLYVCVEQHRILHGFDWNLGEEGVFSLSSVGKGVGSEKELIWKSAAERRVPAHFFSLQKRRREGCVEDVSALIGANGSGKTSFASFFNAICIPNIDGRYAHYALVYEYYKGTAKRFRCIHGESWKISKNQLPIEMRERMDVEVVVGNALPFQFVYYTPFASTEQVVSEILPSVIDLSTGGLLRRRIGKENGGDIFEGLAAQNAMWILTRLSTFASKTPAVAGVLLAGLHYTAFAGSICGDSRPTATSRGVSPRKKFAAKANVESRVRTASPERFSTCKTRPLQGGRFPVCRIQSGRRTVRMISNSQEVRLTISDRGLGRSPNSRMLCALLAPARRALCG